MKIKHWGRVARYTLLTLILGVVTIESYRHQVLGGGKAPSVHALCPYGALESLYNFLFLGSFVQKIYSGTFILLVASILLAIVFRRSFCGILCPFGAIQEFFAKLGQKIFKKRFIIPEKIDRPLRYLKYIILIATLGMAWYLGSLWVAPFDPYSAYAHLWNISGQLEEEPLAIFGFIILFLSVVGSMLYDRFFCKYMCPVGAFYGIIGKFSPTRIVREESSCISCKFCTKACPMNIQVHEEVEVKSAECINCNECVLSCPKKETLSIKTSNKKLRPAYAVLFAAGLFLVPVWTTKIMGTFEVLPAQLAEGQTVAVEDLKGYYTIEEVSEALGISIEEVYKLLHIPSDVPKGTMMKGISEYKDGYNFDAEKEKAAEELGGESCSGEAEEASTSPSKFADVRGSMTIREAAEVVGMSVNEFSKKMEIPEGTPAQSILKDIPNYDFHEMKAKLE